MKTAMDNDEKIVEEEKKTPVKGKFRFGIRLKFSVAIISLVSVIIMTIAAMVVYRESNLLKEQIVNFAKREVIHLAGTAQQNIGIDELALSDAVNELAKIDFFRYVFVLNSSDEILYYFDKRGDGNISHVERKPLDDNVERKLDLLQGSDDVPVLEYADPDAAGKIYDFAVPVSSRIDSKRKIGAVVIGMSDIVIRNEIQNITRLIVVFFLGFLVVSVIGSVILAAVILRPIKRLSHGATVIGKGDFNHRIEVNSRDELGQLAEEFNIMTEMIKEARELEIETRIMNEQLEMARDIQEGLNPMEYYNKNGIQIKGFTRAAQGVGGDYFDFTEIDEHRVCALLSDVSGKGVPASLVMVMIRTVFTTYIDRDDIDCASVVKAINDALSADFAIDKFATLFFVIYDRRTEELSFSNAGQGPLFCYRASLKACTNTTLDGMPIGIMEDVDYKQAKVKFNPGDMVFIYSDGITEMRNSNKDEYGLDRAHRFILDNNHLNANDFVKKIVNDVEQFRGDAPPHDDMTVLVLKRDS